MTEFLTYRNGMTMDESTIKEFLSDYYQRYRQKPPCIVVHPTVKDQVEQMVASLWPGLQVQTVGGCLVGEVWLQLPLPEKAKQLKLEMEVDHVS